MKQTNSLILIAILLLTSACATTGKYEENLKAWVGKPKTKLYSEWGSPNQEYLTPEGKAAALYSNRHTEHIQTNYISSYNVDHYCETTFIIDNKTGLIERWQWKGNSCTAN